MSPFRPSKGCPRGGRYARGRAHLPRMAGTMSGMVSTPPAAMTADSVSIVQNAERLDVVSPEDRIRSWVSSSNERR